MAAEPIKDAPSGLRIELNKLETQGPNCRAYMVFGNKGDRAYSNLRLDLIFFGTDGVIAKRLAVDAGPLAAGKTSVQLFDIADLPCAGIGQILLNDIPVCEAAEGRNADCLRGVSVSSRVPNVAFTQ